MTFRRATFLPAILVAAGTPPEIGKAVQSSQADFNKLYFAQIERWKDIVARTGVKVEK